MLRLGSRGSQLALFQARLVAQRLQAAAGTACEIVVIKTSGDRLQDAPLSEIGGKRLFVKEIEDALLTGDIDLAVHSSKDMPAVLPDGLEVGAVLEREDPRDALVLPVSPGSRVQSPESVPARSAPAASAASRSFRSDFRAPNSRTCAGIWTRDSGSSTRVSTISSCLRRQDCAGSDSGRAFRCPCRSTSVCRPRARASSRSRVRADDRTHTAGCRAGERSRAPCRRSKQNVRS